MAQPQELWLPFNSHLLRDEELQRKVFGIRWQALYDSNRAALYAVSDAYKSAVRRSPPESLIIRDGAVRFLLYNDTIWADQPRFNNAVSQQPANSIATHLRANAQSGSLASGHFPLHLSAGYSAPQGQRPGNLNPAVQDFVPVRNNHWTPQQPEQHQYQSPHQQPPKVPECASNLHAEMLGSRAPRRVSHAPVNDIIQQQQMLWQEETPQQATASSSSFEQSRELLKEIWQRQPPQSGRDSGNIDGSLNRIMISGNGDPRRMSAFLNIQRWQDGHSAFTSPDPESKGETINFSKLDRSYDTSGPTIWSSHMDFSSQIRETSPRTSLFSSNTRRSSEGVDATNDITKTGAHLRSSENIDIANSNLDECAYFGSQVVNVASVAGDLDPHDLTYDGIDDAGTICDIEPRITGLPFFDCPRREQEMLIKGTWEKEARRFWGCIQKTSTPGEVFHPVKRE